LQLAELDLLLLLLKIGKNFSLLIFFDFY
jgi:hypothetical protein